MQIKETSLGVSTDLDVIDKRLDVKDKFLIDAGCGNMHLSKALAERGAHVLAIDPDPIQAEKNRAAEVTTNVGFTETGAEQIPVEDRSVDGVLFPLSFHHIPVALHDAVIKETLRILKPDGFLYAMEPVAEGDLNEVMKLFHDETEVRAQAKQSLEALAAPHFSAVDVILYSRAVQYNSWEHFASRYADKSFNTQYSEADIRQPHVEKTFMEVGEASEFRFETPMRVTYMREPNIPT